MLLCVVQQFNNYLLFFKLNSYKAEHQVQILYYTMGSCCGKASETGNVQAAFRTDCKNPLLDPSTEMKVCEILSFRQLISVLIHLHLILQLLTMFFFGFFVLLLSSLGCKVCSDNFVTNGCELNFLITDNRL